MEVYKVVEKNTRNCSNWTMFKNQYKDIDNFVYNEGLKFKRKHQDYFPRYLKGRIIKEAKGSIGILCFIYKEDARSFINLYISLRDCIIIKVKGVNKKSGLIRLHGACGGPGLFNIKKESDYWGTMTPPYGTINFESVEVLE